MKRSTYLWLAILLSAALSAGLWPRNAALAQTARPSDGLNVFKPSDQKVTIYTRPTPPLPPSLMTCPSSKPSPSTASPGPSTSPPTSASSSTATTTSSALSRSTAIDPKPLYGTEIPAKVNSTTSISNAPSSPAPAQRLHAQPARRAKKSPTTAACRNWFDPALIQQTPRRDEARRFPRLHHQHARRAPSSSRSCGRHQAAAAKTVQPHPHRRRPHLRRRTAPADAFRPAFSDRQPKIYFSHDLNRDLLPKLAAPKSMPDIRLYVPLLPAPLGRHTCFFGFEAARRKHAPVRPRIRPRRRHSTHSSCAPTSPPKKKNPCSSTSSRSASTSAA